MKTINKRVLSLSSSGRGRGVGSQHVNCDIYKNNNSQLKSQLFFTNCYHQKFTKFKKKFTFFLQIEALFLITVVSIATGRADDEPLVLSVINTLYHFSYDMSINIVSQSNGTNLQIVNKYLKTHVFIFSFLNFGKPAVEIKSSNQQTPPSPTILNLIYWYSTYIPSQSLNRQVRIFEVKPQFFGQESEFLKKMVTTGPDIVSLSRYLTCLSSQ